MDNLPNTKQSQGPLMAELQTTNLIEYCYIISQRNKERLSTLKLFLNITRLKFPIKNKKPSV